MKHLLRIMIGTLIGLAISAYFDLTPAGSFLAGWFGADVAKGLLIIAGAWRS